uniref:Uncharacterized protein n=1 Tax=Vitis vinifera TaxID=29760 RepID=A5AG70_VITVI|nr:hypothetical protein VITISV_025359 [Vitis vinifera]
MLVAHIGKLQETSRHCAKNGCETLRLKHSPLPSGVKIPDVDIWVKWRRQPDSGCYTSGWKVAATGCNGGSRMNWRQPDGITTRVE